MTTTTTTSTKLSPDLEKFVDEVKSLAHDLTKGFDHPEDDWVPAMFVQDADGEFFPGLIDPRAFSSDAMKEAFSEALPRILAEIRAEKYAVLLTAWMLIKKSEDPDADMDSVTKELMDECDGSLENHPDRQECLFLTGGSADEPFFTWAVIMRDGEQPPVLGEWQTLPAGEGTLQGRFAQGFRNDGGELWNRP